jgi:hypothetical protein
MPLCLFTVSLPLPQPFRTSATPLHPWLTGRLVPFRKTFSLPGGFDHTRGLVHPNRYLLLSTLSFARSEIYRIFLDFKALFQILCFQFSQHLFAVFNLSSSVSNHFFTENERKCRVLRLNQRILTLPNALLMPFSCKNLIFNCFLELLLLCYHVKFQVLQR